RSLRDGWRLEVDLVLAVEASLNDLAVELVDEVVEAIDVEVARYAIPVSCIVCLDVEDVLTLGCDILEDGCVLVSCGIDTVPIEHEFAEGRIGLVDLVETSSLCVRVPELTCAGGVELAVLHHVVTYDLRDASN